MSVKIITDSASDVLTPYHPAVSVQIGRAHV